MLAIGSQRGLFDIPTDVAYFNTAYNGPQLNASRTALVAAAAAKSRPWERTPEDFFEPAERVRDLASQVFGGSPGHWAVTSSATYGVCAAARAIEPSLGPGDRIVLMDGEFPANVLPWRRVAELTDARIDTVRPDGRGGWTEALLDALRPGVRVAAVSPCHWTDGMLVDLAAVGRRCREIDAALVVDATQALGAHPVDLDVVDPDFLVAAGYKWLLCPYGFGLLYASSRRQEDRPLEESWLARAGAEDFAGLVNYRDDYREGARRFDISESCAATILAGAVPALEQLARWGVAAVSKSLAHVNILIAARLEALGFTVPPAAERAAHMFGGSSPDWASGRDLAATLRNAGVFVSRRGSSLRFAPHLHVTHEDITRLFEALEAARSEG